MDSYGSASADEAQPGYVFGSLRLEPDGTLLRGETRVELPPRELAALRLLLARQGLPVSPLELKQALGNDVSASTKNVFQVMASLRARLKPDNCIQTVSGRGYCFTLEAKPYTGISAAALPCLAILPLLTGHGVPEYLGPAVAAETIARLSAMRPPIAVLAAKDSAFTLARRGLTPRQIGKTLQADLVLAGALRALPDRYRLRVEMLRVADGHQLWTGDMLLEWNRAAAFETALVNLVTLQLEGAEVSLSASAEAGTAKPFREAYDLCQRAEFEWQSLERHRMQDGLQRLLRAIELAPSFAPARVSLAHLAVAQAIFGFMPPPVAADLVRRAAGQTDETPPPPEAVLPALGWVSFHFDRDLPAALRAFAWSAHLPYDPWITRMCTMFALGRRRFDEAHAMLNEALRIDPWSAWLHASLAWTFHLAGDARASVKQIESALAQFPAHQGVNLYAAIILAYNGQAARAVELARALAEHLPYFDLASAVHAYALALAGQPDEARMILERLQWLSRERYVLNSFSPAAYVALGDYGQAIAELRAAADARCPWFFQMLADPRLKALRGRSEFTALQSILTQMENQAPAGSH